MLNETTFKAFYRIFQGNTAFYVHHQAPFAEHEGKLKAKWCGFAVYGTKSFPHVPEGREKGDLVPVTKELYREHLNGGNGLGIAPICNTKDRKNVCYFAAIDIDVYDADFAWLIGRLYQLGFRFAAFISKSGGLHIYFFFRDAEPAERVIETLNKMVEVFGLNRLFVNDKKKSKVEIFPKQSSFIPGDSNANGIFLPFYNSASKGTCINKMLTAERQLIGIEKAIPIIGDMFTSIKEMESALENLPYSDAPFCIQMILLTGALQEGDGRSNFLFSAALYLKKKYQENFEGMLRKMNNCLEAPLEDKDIISTYKSVTDEKKNYDFYQCKKSPCADYCDKTLCGQREFGLSRNRNNRFSGTSCWGELSKVMAAGGEEPYFLWPIQVDEEKGFKTVRIDSVADLYNQSTIQKLCWRDLNWAPFSVKQNDWVAIVNKAMGGIENRLIDVPRETDTTELAALHDSFSKFLTHGQIRGNSAPFMIKVGRVHHSDGVYYFTTEGLMRFLRLEKFQLGRVNLREQLLRYGCAEGEVIYTTKKGVDIKIKCWKKSDDEELSAMGTSYDDVYAGYADIFQKDKKEKDERSEDRKGGDGDDIKF